MIDTVKLTRQRSASRAATATSRLGLVLAGLVVLFYAITHREVHVRHTCEMSETQRTPGEDAAQQRRCRFHVPGLRGRHGRGELCRRSALPRCSASSPATTAPTQRVEQASTVILDRKMRRHLRCQCRLPAWTGNSSRCMRGVNPRIGETIQISFVAENRLRANASRHE